VEARVATKTVTIKRWLPYWAVFQSDTHQTLHSWVYRTWVLVSVLSAIGYLLYRVGIYREAGIVQPASMLIGDLLRWCLFGSVTLVIVLAAGSISGERGTMADSVLSRGISRYQYFLGKWHARLMTVLCTFLLMGVLALTSSYFLLHEDLSLSGSLVALLTMAAFLGVVISGGVTASAIFNSTLLAIAVLWIVVYGAGFALSLLPVHIPSPYQALNSLPYILRGEYNLYALGRLMGWCAIASCVLALFGLACFSRRDV
jgi:ABC-type transport system involved in multi-copper enzyme maturation permease subunit